jgi:hypothetical protein
MDEKLWMEMVHAMSPTHGMQTYVTRAIGAAIEWLARHQRDRSRWEYVTSWSGGLGAGAEFAVGVQGGSIELSARASNRSSAPQRLALDYGWLMLGLGVGLKVKKVGVGAGGSLRALESHGAVFRSVGEADFEPGDFDGFCCGLYAEAVAGEGLYVAAMLLGLSHNLAAALRSYERHCRQFEQAMNDHSLNPIRVARSYYRAAGPYLRAMGELAHIVYIVKYSPQGPFRGLILMNGDSLGLPSAGASIVLGGARHRML